MGRGRVLIWYFFGLAVVGLGLLAVAAAIHLALLPWWPSSYSGSLASLLTADYGAEPVDLTPLPPVRPELIFDLVREEESEAGVDTAIVIPPGPLSTLEAIASATPTYTPSPTPRPTNTPTPTPTPTSTPLPTATPTTTPTITPTPPGPDTWLSPLPTKPPSSDTSRPTSTPDQFVSPLATPRP